MLTERQTPKRVLLMGLIFSLVTLSYAVRPHVETPIPDTSLVQGDSLVLQMLDYFWDVEDGDFLGLLDIVVEPASFLACSARGINRMVIYANSPTPGTAVVTARVIDTEQFIAADSFSVTVSAATSIRTTSFVANHGKGISIRLTSQGSIRFVFGTERVSRFAIHDAQGRIIDTFPIRPGPFVEWDAKRLASGVYFATLTVKGQSVRQVTRKMVVFQNK